ncbi:hypothetical protein Enr13x_59560 [Stieleria neptunia]|uniref:Uncharacterized protein n=1 Tax=Stieleria neptunia TaxID=2527979 RepID=A0A518HYY3_9BACT|nr:hypothetical protein [Stieleria neptunia]QDV46052.1 hypothetical protein Enr13x_59560 [Stieleria neptunia]
MRIPTEFIDPSDDRLGNKLRLFGVNDNYLASRYAMEILSLIQPGR